MHFWVLGRGTLTDRPDECRGTYSIRWGRSPAPGRPVAFCLVWEWLLDADSLLAIAKTVLLLADHFPPIGGAGAQRAVNLVRHLPALGWVPIVVTGLG